MLHPSRFLLALILLIGLGGTLPAQTPAGYEPGAVATDFSLKNVDGEMVSLADYTGAKGFIVVFTCNACPVAKKYEDRIIALDAQFKAQGYPVIAINPNDPARSPGDSFDHMVERAQAKGFTFPYLWDETQEIARAYGARVTPHTYVLEKTDAGLIVRFVGAIDNAADGEVAHTYVADAVRNLLAGEAVAKPYEKPFGCSVKYSK